MPKSHKIKKSRPTFNQNNLLGTFHIFQINKINFAQKPKIAQSPDTFVQKCYAMAQTDHTKIRPKTNFRNASSWKILYLTIRTLPMTNFKKPPWRHSTPTQILHMKHALKSHFEMSSRPPFTINQSMKINQHDPDELLQYTPSSARTHWPTEKTAANDTNNDHVPPS